MDKIYACSDLHGMYSLWKQIKNFLDENDELVFLGDAIDRGPDGIHILEEMLHDKRVLFLKGNHEDMMLKVVKPYLEGDASDTTDLTLWMMNGGEKTYRDFKKLPRERQEQLVQRMDKFMLSEMAYLNKENLFIHLTHAGMTPGHRPENKDDFIWSRMHFKEEWPKEDYDRYEIHGHTPTDSLKQELEVSKKIPKCDVFYHEIPKAEIYRYADGHKIDIDLGCFYSNKTALIDLDTLEIKYFSI